MPPLRLAIIDPFHPAILSTIRTTIPSDWSIDLTSDPSPEEHRKAFTRADVAFVMATPVPRSLIEAAPRLRFIQKLGAGTDRIDTAYCVTRGIGVARLQAGNNIPVAEHTLLMMLAASRRLAYLDRETRGGIWNKEASRGVSRQIHGKTVGLIGFGAIGREVARLLRPFEATILYFDARRATADVELALGVKSASLDELLAQSDIVSLHVPLLAETTGILSRERIRAMKPGAIVINCARGGLIDEAALNDALNDGHIFAAGLDAFSDEPPIGNPLLQSEATVVTPHSAGATIDNFRSVVERAVSNTLRFLGGDQLPPDDVVVAGRQAATT